MRPALDSKTTVVTGSGRERVETALLGGPRRYTRDEAVQAAGVTLDWSQGIWHALGFAAVDGGARVFTEGDIEALRTWDLLISSGRIPAAGEVPHVRAVGQAMSRLADWQVREMMSSIAQVAGQDEEARAAVATEMTSTLVPVVERLMTYAWRRHLAAAAGRILAVPSDELSTATIVVGFADIVGYTSTARHSDIDELAALLDSFEEDAAKTVVANHGWMVKSVGDEVLFAAEAPREAAEIALRLSEPGRAARGLPELRVGMALGRVLTRFGDVYGPVVNLASRLTSLAKPESILVDRALAEALRSDDRYRLLPQRPTTVPGYNRLRSWSLREQAR
jgi:adenylate cyclase